MGRRNGTRQPRPKARNVEATRLEIAEYLVLRWAPGAELRLLKKRGSPTLYQSYEDQPDPDDIAWNPGDGLTRLLHEIGHFRIGKRPIRNAPVTQAETVIEEAVAWQWAEWAARHENLNFDYAAAERAFDTYLHVSETTLLPLRLRWRHKG